MPSVARYQLGNAVIEVEAHDVDTLEWLDEALRPWLTAPAESCDAYRVRLVRSESERAALEKLSESLPARERVCFALDSQLLAFPAWARDGEVVLRDAARECFYRVRERCVEIVARPGSLRARVGVMRVVREIACAHMRGEPGTIELHGAAIAIDGRVALILGPKRAGKTSLLLHLLRSGRARFVANDRVFVREEGGAHAVLGVPTLVRLRPDTLEIFPRLREGLPSRGRPALASLRELGAMGNELPPAAGDDAPLGLTPAQLCRQLGVLPAPSGRLAAILFPEIQPTAAGCELEPVPIEVAAEHVRANVYGRLCRPRPRSVFEELVGRPDQCQRGEAVLSERVAAAAAVYRCTLGRAAYDDPRGALRLLRQVALIGDGSSQVAAASPAGRAHSGGSKLSGTP